MDAITLLETQHREVETLAQEFVDLGSEAVQRKKEIVREVIEKLSIHATLEEMAFYPAVADAMPGLADHIESDREGHQQIKNLLRELLGKDPERPTVRHDGRDARG